MVFQSAALAEVVVAIGRNTNTEDFRFTAVPSPATNDAATSAEFTLVDGARDPNGGELSVLHDGRVATSEDDPAANFFFRAGGAGGRIRIDLGRVLAVKQVNTYSWHAGSRAPQVYQLYAAEGAGAGFNATPSKETDPASCGWKRLASVDTRPADGPEAGQHGVMVADPAAGILGQYRYLLLDVARTEDRDAFGHTFFSEIDVLDAAGPAPIAVTAGSSKPILSRFATPDGRYHFTIDATAAPDLEEWAETKLRPVVLDWYPKVVALLPSEGFAAATNVTLRFRNDMGGTPASAGGDRINLNSGWFRRELDREARGSVVHEMVHVVQSYGRARRTNPNATRTPGWVVEGMADYVRWFLYEPETKGAEITARNLARAKHDASYRVTGNFLDWVVRNHDRDLLRKLNAAAREGRYAESHWRDWTGKSLQELGDEWRKFHEDRLAPAKLEGR